MKRLALIVIVAAGCESEIIPPQKVSLPTYTIEEHTVKLAASEPLLGRSFVYIRKEWVTVKTHADWTNAAGKKATIVRQSDGKKFLTIDDTTGPIEEQNGERKTRSQ